jgi:hypothetical protein
MTLTPGDPLAHRALESLLRAESSVRRRLSSDLEREGISATGFSVLIVLATDRRAASVTLTLRGREVVDRLFPEHTARVSSTFAVLDEDEKRSLESICRKLAA